MTKSFNIQTASQVYEDGSFFSRKAVDRAGAEFAKAPDNISSVRRVQQYRHARMLELEGILEILGSAAIPPAVLVSGRLKRLDTVLRKLRRRNSRFRLSNLDDIIGFRAVCPSLNCAFDLSERIRRLSVHHNAKNYIRNPHTSQTGYRAIHHIVRTEHALASGESIRVGVEIQVRTFYQHMWAVYSESFGEATKVGRGVDEVRDHLHELGKRIQDWEEEHPDVVQRSLPRYTDTKNIVVVWRTNSGELLNQFYYEISDAMNWLNYLETAYHDQRDNALLLVGMVDNDQEKTLEALGMTHPLYVRRRIADPTYWMPSLDQ